MKVKTTWLADQKGLHREYIGEVNIVALIQATIELHEDSRFDALNFLIEDHLSSTNTPFTTQDIDALDRFVHMRSLTKTHALKLAVVSRSSAKSLAAANYVAEKMRRCYYKVMVFTVLADAKAWAQADREQEQAKSDG